MIASSDLIHCSKCSDTCSLGDVYYVFTERYFLALNFALFECNFVLMILSLLALGDPINGVKCDCPSGYFGDGVGQMGCLPTSSNDCKDIERALNRTLCLNGGQCLVCLFNIQ